MSVLSRVNSCTRARRCILPKYRDTEYRKSIGGDGCCPGQTGHHLLPGEMFRDNPNCPRYTDNKHKDAPVICTEGTGNNFEVGTHGKMHEAFDKKIEDHKTSGWWGGEKDTISYEKARDMAIATVMSTFPESRCNPKCLRAQLDKFYDDMCQPNILKALSGSNGSSKRSNGSEKIK